MALYFLGISHWAKLLAVGPVGSGLPVLPEILPRRKTPSCLCKHVNVQKRFFPSAGSLQGYREMWWVTGQNTAGFVLVSTRYL